MLERRSAERRKTFIGGRIEQPGNLGTMDCTVRDLGAHGARLEFHNTASVANRFTLVLPFKGRRAEARIVWRKFGEAGVTFATPMATLASRDIPSQDAIEEKLRASEARRRALEAKLSVMNEMA